MQRVAIMTLVVPEEPEGRSTAVLKRKAAVPHLKTPPIVSRQHNSYVDNTYLCNEFPYLCIGKCNNEHCATGLPTEGNTDFPRWQDNCK
jgi:hypothetical protein